MSEAAPQPQPPQTKTEYQRFVNEFMELDKKVMEYIEKFENGSILYECVPQEPSQNLADFMQKLAANFLAFQEMIKSLIEQRNNTLQLASAMLRAEVMPEENAPQRGIDGKPTTMRFGPFEVSSRTHRSFDADKLIPLLEQAGLKSRLFDLTYVDKQSGELRRTAEQQWKIAFEPLKNWLRESNLETILQTAYAEKEDTPAVTGPKPIGWMGQEMKKKGK